MSVFSIYQFSNLEDFPTKEYSRLKFGCNESAKNFGYLLADKFYDNNKTLLLSRDCVVIPSPYNIVENAATILTKYFFNRINHLLVRDGGHNIDYHVIRRKVSYINDYGFLSKEERKSLIDNDEFYLNKEYLKDRTLIFIDDVKISGTHEDKLKEILDRENMENPCHFLYIGEYFGIEYDIEAKINFASIQSFSDFIKIIDGNEVLVRPIKYLLSRSKDEMLQFLYDVSEENIKKFYYGALAEGYYRIPEYQENINILKEIVE